MENKQTGNGILSDGFPPVSTREWEDKIKVDLKGEDYEKKLVWKTHDQYRIRPYYRKEDLGGIEYLESLPGQSPYLRGPGGDDNAWLIRQDLLVQDPESANHQALEILKKGATSLGFDLSYLENSEAAIHTLLKDLPLEQIPLNFLLEGNFREMLGWLHSYSMSKKIDPAKITGSISLNPLGRLTATGNFHTSMQEDFSEIADCLKFAKKHLPLFRIIHNSGNVIHESGASVTQVLAYTLAMGSEYLVKLTDMGISLEGILPRMQFEFSVGSSYFMEIAKLRAARFLWTRILEGFPSTQNPPPMYIASMTSRWNQTLYDPHVNMLRGTTASMSAILGGADSLCVSPFDQLLKKSSDMAVRIARNTQIILKEESHLDKVIDPAAGSYYIENLTDTLITGAWELFLQTEQKGGYQASLTEGFIQASVKSIANSRLMNLATRKEKLLGTNSYPILDEKANIPGTMDSGKQIKGSSDQIIEPLLRFRGSDEFEKMRLRTENHPGKQPVVFIIPLGNQAMRRTRATFTMNFFACAGFRVIDNIGQFSTVKQGMAAAYKAKADIVVLCSSDDEYPAMAADFVAGAGANCIPVIAGYPSKHMEALTSVGIEHFIHVRSNVLEELKNFQKLIGI